MDFVCFTAGVVSHVQLKIDRPACAETIEDLRNIERNTRADDHHVDVRQKCAVERSEQRRLNLVQEVDADDPGVAFLGEKDLDEVGDDR